MTLKQKKFVEEIIKPKGKGRKEDSNTQAAIKAGYSPKTAYSIASENLNKPEIKAEIDKRKAEIEAKTDYTIEFVRQKMIDLLNMSIEANDRTNIKGALELLGKHKAMFTDKLISTQDNVKPLSDKELEILQEQSREAIIKLSKTG